MFETNEVDYKKIALNGLLKLATAKVNDIMKIMFIADNLDENKLDEINFSSVSEIKRGKDGDVQVKFFNRQEAFESLYRFADENASNSEAEDFLKSITEN